ncbi:hypothetical protein B0H67DRAFT_119331 [Lasiosphaeris hirsuta]|uniref:Secreted protein n=1 Tax=Lasiosphaeris hirsuta TaxID=260670 RepID=A0AA40E2U0_9PEZI|nr:hypothetical protein B0H67DRAFT_119331 [Lasiosphaeris hirsuta]
MRWWEVSFDPLCIWGLVLASPAWEAPCSRFGVKVRLVRRPVGASHEPCDRSRHDISREGREEGILKSQLVDRKVVDKMRCATWWQSAGRRGSGGLSRRWSGRGFWPTI